MVASSPKSVSIRIGTSAATASRAAVDDTVARPAASPNASLSGPVWNRIPVPGRDEAAARPSPVASCG